MDSKLLTSAKEGHGPPSDRVRPSNDDSTQAALVLDELRDLVDALAGAHISEHERPLAAHALALALHVGQRGAHVGREIDLVDDQQIRARNAGAALGGDFLSGGYVDDVDG